MSEWQPSAWGQRITGTPAWRLVLANDAIELVVAGRNHQFAIEDEGSYRIHHGLIWTDITLDPSRATQVKVDGLPNADGKKLIAALQAVVTEKRILKDVALINNAYGSMRQWLSEVLAARRAAETDRRWVTHEAQQSLLQRRPSSESKIVRERIQKPEIRSRLTDDPALIEQVVQRFDSDWPSYWAALNEQHVRRELIACKTLFDRVESQPLTEEQARAVICFDNRLQLVASAGSGKTSTMVAKAAYAIHRGIVKPSRIVMLAFNKSAATELRDRARRSFERLGMTGVNVEASTFHALGRSIIGKATGEMPDVPDWAVDAAAGLRKLSEIVNQLKDRSIQFRTQWDLFRLVFGRDLPPAGAKGTPDIWDETGTGRMLTLNGERVRSQEEAILANWLFYSGVKYEYERPYEFRTANENHRQYKPDFYYPDIGLYHEHFALNAQGQAPAHLENYAQDVAWKRQLHIDKGTKLFETTSHGLRKGDDLDRLAKALTARGIVLDPNPDRPTPDGGQKPMEHQDLVTLMRTFISHAKSNSLKLEHLHRRLDGVPEDTFKHRHRMFLDIAGPIFQAWDAALIDDDGIDFEDMLNLAAEHLENGRYEAPYDLVMADEFQDASRARARLCRALVQKPGRYFFAVGDDWQSINRFAGADVSVMTGFREWFGHGQILKLERTFRCPQELCDVSSRFVSVNPAQIKKQVHSSTPPVGPVLQAFQVDHRDKLQGAVRQHLDGLCQQLQSGEIPAGRNGKVSVFILGRYRADRAYLPTEVEHYNRWLDLSFSTVHSSKGSEADYVILPGMVSVVRGRSFPDARADDPVLALAMPSCDSFPLGEERRLFYVALTRARRGVVMLTVRGQHSSFLRELADNKAVTVTDRDGEVIAERTCPGCGQGVIVTRSGRYGEFESCSNFPTCLYKPRLDHQKASRRSPTGHGTYKP